MNVRLRKWEKKDAPHLVLLANNKLVSDKLRDRFPFPYLLKDADDWIAFNLKIDPPQNFAIEADGLLVGGCGIAPKEDIYRHSGEIGYWIGHPFWGQGIGTEAIKLLLQIIQKDFPQLKRIFAEVFSSNLTSMKVLSRNGFYLESMRRKAIIKNDKLQDDCIWVKLIT